MNDTARALIGLLQAAVNEETWQPSPKLVWGKLLKLARYHHLEPILYYPLRGRQDVPEEVRKALEDAHQLAVFRDVQQDHIAQIVGDALVEAKVPHILLRGALLKHDYPFPDMRLMSDLDYLVRTDDYPMIRQVAKELGAHHYATDGGHFSFLFPPGLVVEFHPNLIHVASPVGTGINPGWQYVRSDSGPYRQELTEEGFYLNMLCHLAYHFAEGGTGVRSVLDLWVYRRHQPQPDREIVCRELERAGMLEFAKQIEDLAQGWFGPSSDSYKNGELERYILDSGTYGTTQQAVLNTASFSSGESGASALFRQAFRPRGDLENRFPWVRGRAWLLPVAWCARAVRAAVLHRGHIWRWGKLSARVTKEDVAAQRALLKRFGLHVR